MGVYIKGLNKAEAQNILRMCLYDNEVVEVAEPHGRLIDADALIDLWHGCKMSGDINPIIDVRPTVIEAEDK